MKQIELYPCWEDAKKEFDRNRISVWAAGVRCGKDCASISIGIDFFKKFTAVGGCCKWLLIAPSERLAKPLWRELKRTFPKELINECDEKRMTLHAMFGGMVRVTGATEQDIISDGMVDLVTISEAGRIKNLVQIVDTLDKTCLDKDTGRMIISGTPNGKNDFYKLFLRGSKNNRKHINGWYSLTYEWTRNPDNKRIAEQLIDTRKGKMVYEDDLRRRIGEKRYQYTYLARFRYSLLIDIEHKIKTFISKLKNKKG